MTTAALVHDDGPRVGLGHRRRMDALAEMLRQRGVTAVLRPNATSAQADIVVVDSYAHRADAADRFRGRLVAAVDDLCRRLDVAVIVDPNPGAAASDHGVTGRVLAGPAYALLSPPTAVRRPEASDSRAVLVTTGGGDLGEVGAAIASELAEAAPASTVSLVVGRPAEDLTGPAGVAPAVQHIVARDGLDEHLAASAVVISAGGVSMLEALRLGCPTVAIALAANQARAVAGAATAGAILAATRGTAVAEALRLLEDGDLRQRLSTAGRALVDGQGAARVADVLLDELARR